METGKEEKELMNNTAWGIGLEKRKKRFASLQACSKVKVHLGNECSFPMRLEISKVKIKYNQIAFGIFSHLNSVFY